VSYIDELPFSEGVVYEADYYWNGVVRQIIKEKKTGGDHGSIFLVSTFCSIFASRLDE
jgi:hypothetical protein